MQEPIGLERLERLERRVTIPRAPAWAWRVGLALALGCGPATFSTAGDGGGSNEEPFCDDHRSKCTEEPSPTAEERAECRALLAGPCATEARANLQCLRDNELCTTTGRADPTFATETCKLQSKAQRDCTSAAPPPTDAGGDAG